MKPWRAVTGEASIRRLAPVAGRHGFRAASDPAKENISRTGRHLGSKQSVKIAVMMCVKDQGTGADGWQLPKSLNTASTKAPSGIPVMPLQTWFWRAIHPLRPQP